MNFLLTFIGICIFFSVFLFAYGSYRLIKELQEMPLKDETWDEDEEEVSGFQKSFAYRVALFFAQSLARVNVYWNLSPYEAVVDKKLDAAGRPWDLKATEFIGLKELTAILGGLVGLWITRFDKDIPAPLMFIAGMMILGFFIPNMILKRHLRDRQYLILRDLPFCCDLLSLSVDAGLDFGSALDKVVVNGPPGPLIHELNIVTQETKIGKSRREALTDMMDRLQLQEITNFVGALIQAERMGVGFASVLRIQSVTVRRSRFERAEKRAQQMPVMILLPIVFINLITIAIILIVPLLGIITDYG